MKFTDVFRKRSRQFCSAVIVAAGSSTRMGADKLMMEIANMPVIIRSIKAFDDCDFIDEIIIVTQSEKIVEIAKLCETYKIQKVTKILVGGETRTQSALAGVSETNPDVRLIAIHDGARPLVCDNMIRSTIHQAALNKAAVPAVPVKDTIKKAEDGFVTKTIDRSALFAVQTPQVFHADLIKGALTRAVTDKLELTDDAMALEAMGVPVFLAEGDYDNIKITTPQDIAIAEAILKNRGAI